MLYRIIESNAIFNKISVQVWTMECKAQDTDDL